MASDREVDAGAMIIATSPMIDTPKLPSQSWRGLARAVLAAAERVREEEARAELAEVLEQQKQDYQG